MQQYRELFIISFLFIAIVVILVINWPYINEEINIIPEEEITDEEKIEEETEKETFILTDENRKDLITFLVENPAFSAFYYDDTQNLSPAFLALYFINWETNPQLTDEEKTMLAENYDTDEWYQLGDYGEIEQYIPISNIEEYFQKMTGQEMVAPESENCMKYIPEIEGFILTCGHGLFTGNVERLTFGSNGDEMLYYITDVIHQNDDKYVFEIQEYIVLDYVENLGPIIRDFINGDITKEEANLEKNSNYYYLMRHDDDNWQFIAYSDENF